MPTFPFFCFLNVFYMFKTPLGIAVVFNAVVVSPLLQECTTACQVGSQTGYVEGDCPVKLTSVQLQPGSECVTVHVWMKADDFLQAPRIEILSPIRETIRPTMRTKKNNKMCDNKRIQRLTRVRCDNVTHLLPHSSASLALWEVVHNCVKAEAEHVVSVSYRTTSTSCSVSYTIPDPKPDFDLSVNLSSKSITVTVKPGEKVLTRWCYQKGPYNCMAGPLSPPVTVSPSAVLNIPYLLPCVCVQAYYTHPDALREKKCPFENQTLADECDR